MKLRKFQIKTSDFIFKKLKMDSSASKIYSLADQVGLGKTLVVADVMSKIISEESRPLKDIFIFYVSPSQELLRQNLPKIARYIKDNCELSLKCGGDYWVANYASRITQIINDKRSRSELQTRSSKKCKRTIHVVGLSSEISFKWGGTGTKFERQLLAAGLRALGERDLFYFKIKGTSFFDDLYLLDTSDTERFDNWKKGVHSSSKNQDLIREYVKVLKKIDWNLFEDEFTKAVIKSKKRSSLFVSMLRKYFTFACLEEYSMDKLILDEWHRYKNLFDDSLDSGKIMNNVLDQLRFNKSKPNCALLVSATPFVVKFDGDEGRADLKLLSRIVLGKSEGDKSFDKIVEYQDKFTSALYNEAVSLVEGKPLDLSSSVFENRQALQGRLRKISVRTERPHFNNQVFNDENEALKNKYYRNGWEDIDLLTSVSNPDSTSPVVSMWNDSVTFPLHGYQIKSNIQKQKLEKKISLKRHWKLKFLQEKINNDYSDFFIGGELIPPLWLPVSYHDKGLKKLIFSHYLVSPEEISQGLDFGKAFDSDEKSKNILGSFPLKKKESKNWKDVRGWEICYPFIFGEFHSQINYSEVSKFMATCSDVNAHEISLIESMLLVDYLLLRKAGAEPYVLERIKIRSSLLHLDYPRIVESFEDIFKGNRNIFISQKNKEHVLNALNEQNPGWIFSSSIGRLFKSSSFTRINQYKSLNSKFKESYELALMEAAEGLLRLFSSAEAQHIRSRLARKLKTKIKVQPGNNHQEFVRSYSRFYELESTIDDILSVLDLEHPDKVENIFHSFRNSITLHKRRNGSRYIRPFIDNGTLEVTSINQSEDKVHPSALREAFNSPFAPYVLVTTSVGQEGIDFHLYCKDIIHWSPPSCPSVLNQREGRLDRFNSLGIRVLKKTIKEEDYSIDENEFSPDFVFFDKSNGDRLNKVNRTVLYLPHSSQEKVWHRCKERAYLTGILVGSPDPEAVELKFSAIKSLCGDNHDLWLKVLKLIDQRKIYLGP